MRRRITLLNRKKKPEVVKAHEKAKKQFVKYDRPMNTKILTNNNNLRPGTWKKYNRTQHK